MDVAALEEFLAARLACPLCRAALVRDDAGRQRSSCGIPFSQKHSYTDFLHPPDPLSSQAETDLSDHFQAPRTAYWTALRQVAEPYSSSLPSVFFQYLGGHTRCLDIGASLVEHGRLKPHLQGYEGILSVYCGLDPDERQLESTDERLFVARGIGERLPFADASFDIILLHATLDHCFDYRRALDECLRVMAPHGLISIVLNNDGSWAKRLMRGAASRRRNAAARHHHVFLTPELLMADLRRRGFEVLRLRGTRYLLLPQSILEAASRMLRAGMPTLLRLCDAAGRRLAPSLGGDFHLIARRG